MRKLLGRLLFTGVLLAAGASGLRAASDTPDFKEIYDLLRANAGAVGEEELNRAAVEGLLAKLDSRVWLINPSQTSSAETNFAPVSSSALFDEHYGYIRVARVGPQLPAAFSGALEKLAATNKLKGLVIDLRYANGTDYAAAAKVADGFLGSEQPLLDWGSGSAKSTDKTNAFRQPVAILVNHFTTGAAEALAGVLRNKDVGLLIGTNTAGQASMTKDFTLKNGDTLRLAVSPVKIGDDEVVERLKPDIQVGVSPDDERAYFVDAYKTLPRPGMASGSSTNVASLTVTNKAPRRRLNEAELVRMLREGENPEEEFARPSRALEPVKPAIADPALARAIDLLKALAVVRQTRS
ncbi:MAG TPA: S41 family peptidase [Methylomirabilota bacterium]|nr:S41 family peptidase [Methylomirabilota bacterium]